MISIVIPSKSRPRQLAACLDAIAQLDYDRDRFEVIVVDDGSDTELRSAIIAQMTASNSELFKTLRLSIVRQKNRGPAAARNLGVAFAAGEVVVFTDDDCAPAPDWLIQIEKAVAEYPDCLIGGRIRNALRHNRFSEASQVLVDFLYRYFSEADSQMYFFASNNMACRADLFRLVGGFSESFPTAAAEDREFCYRWLASGHKLYHQPAALILHSHELSLSSFFRQHFNYGCGAYLFHKIKARRAQADLKVEPLSFY
ncbi:MAG TPA: glycosyltransferase, partial [Chroococcales cyanobacterium]